MKRRVKLKNDNYLDSEYVVHNQRTLKKELATINNRLVGLGVQCKQVYRDWNTACEHSTGFYRGSGLDNAPQGETVSDWWYVIHLVHDEKFIKQIAFSFSLRDNHIYVRTMENGTWGSWTSIN